MQLSSFSKRSSPAQLCLAVVALLGTCDVPLRAESPAVETSPLRLERLTFDGRFKQRPAWSSDGTRLVYAAHAGEGISLYVLVVGDDGDEASEPARLGDRLKPEFDAVWQPDGGRLAFTLDQHSPNQGDLEIYTMAADGSDPRPLAVTEGKLSHEEYAAYAPDGKRIAYTSTRDENQELYVVAADGNGARRLTNDPALDMHPAWSPAGDRIAFATNRWGDLELAVIDPESGEITRLTTSPGLDDYPVWSPDGERLAFVSNRTGNFEIFVRHLPTGETVNLTAHPAIETYPAWTPDGRLTFVSNRDAGFDIYAETRDNDFTSGPETSAP